MMERYLQVSNANRMPAVCKKKSRRPWRVSIKEALSPFMERVGRMQVSTLLGRKLRFALDTQTPEDIDFIRVEQVADDFHSRYKKHSKTYEFIVDYGRPKNPMMRYYATHYPYPLDVEKMQVAIQKLEGTHDFTGFTASGTSVEDKVRTITEARLVEDRANHRLLFIFSGNGFLYKQIRNMVGTLLKIGNDRMPIEQIDLILEKKDRNLAGPTAAPNGLYLKEIRYE